MSFVRQSFLVVGLSLFGLAPLASAHLCEANFFGDGVRIRPGTFTRGPIRQIPIEALDYSHRFATVTATDWLTAAGFKRQVEVLKLRSPSDIEKTLHSSLAAAEAKAAEAKNMLALSERQVLYAKYSKELKDAEELIENYSERVFIAAMSHRYPTSLIAGFQADIDRNKEIAVNARLQLSQLNSVSLDSTVRKARQEAAQELLEARLAVLDYLKTHDVPVVYVKYYVENMSIVLVDYNDEFLIMDPLSPEATFWSSDVVPTSI